MAIDSKTPRFLRNYLAGIAAPWFVSINRSINAATGIMGTMLQQGKDNLSQTQIAVTNASTQAQAAGQNAQAASTSAIQSSQSANNAQGYAAQVKAVAESYNKLWLGDLSSDPTTDNNGNPLIDAARYYNTSSKHVRIFVDGRWNDIDATTEAAQQDALVSAAQASQSAAAANSLYVQTAQNTSQVQNLLTQAQSILYWMNTYWIGSSSSDPTQDRNGNPVSNGASYYNSNLGVEKVFLNGQWKTDVTTDITNDIKNRYVDGTWGLGSNNLQVKGLNWSNSDSSPLVSYVDQNSNIQSVTLATAAQLRSEAQRAQNIENDKISGTEWLNPNQPGDIRGQGLHLNGYSGFPYFVYGSDSNSLAGIDLATKDYADRLNNDVNNTLNQTRNDYVKRDGSLNMYGSLNVSLGSNFLAAGAISAGSKTDNQWSHSPAFESQMTGGPVFSYSGLRTSHLSSNDQTYLDLYHGGDKGGGSLFIWSDGHVSSSGDIWAGGDGTKHFYGKSGFSQSADLAENYKSDKPLLPGFVVKISNNKNSEIEYAQKGDSVFGIISTDPGFLLNYKKDAKDLYPVALKGRVPAFVVGYGIKKGDELVLSSCEGKLTKKRKLGMLQRFINSIRGYEEKTVAYALEDGKNQKFSQIEVALK